MGLPWETPLKLVANDAWALPVRGIASRPANSNVCSLFIMVVRFLPAKIRFFLHPVIVGKEEIGLLS